MFKDLSFIFKSPTRAKIVTYFVRQPGAWASAVDVASIIGSTKETALKELSQLLKFGILVSRRAQNVTSYRVNELDELFEPLQGFLSVVTSPSNKEMLSVFHGTRGITLIVSSGLLAGETKSSVELLIVSKSPEAKKTEKAIRKLETMVAVPIRYVLLDEDEYYERRQSYDRLLRDIFEYKHTIVLEKGPKG